MYRIKKKWKSYAFNQISIFLHAPATSGIYVLHNPTRCLLVGETKNIRRQLLGHLQGDHPLITLWNPSGFCFETCSETLRLNRKRELALQFQPVIQERYGSADVYDVQDALETVGFSLPPN